MIAFRGGLGEHRRGQTYTVINFAEGMATGSLLTQGCNRRICRNKKDTLNNLEMRINNLTTLFDERTQCYSVIYELTVKDYLSLIQPAYDNKGNLTQQRDPIKTSSALRIRKRMVEDIRVGAILPPLVIGVLVDTDIFSKVEQMSVGQFSELIVNTKVGNITIIDGMQRTTALFEATRAGLDTSKYIRIEFWLATKLNSLIYRMLVLNTGQVPWNIRRQIETVFNSMINEIKEKVPQITIYIIDEDRRRTQGGQYHANDIIELYLTFGARKEKVDTKERLADEFTRLDFIEATENADFADHFYLALNYLVKTDIEFSRYQGKFSNDSKEGSDTLISRFSAGQDLFKSQPVRVGFITAIAKKIYGRPGVEKSEDQKQKDATEVFEQLKDFITDLQKMQQPELHNFLKLELLTEKLSIRSGKVGEFEREYFTKAFDTLISERFDVSSLEVCWVAY